MAAQQQIDAVDRLEQGAIVGQIGMGQRHDQLGTLPSQRRDRLLGALDHGRDGDRRAGRGQFLGGRGQEAEHADLEARHLEQPGRHQAQRRLAVRAGDIGGEPGKAGLLDPLGQDVGAEIELVIARHGQHEAQAVVEVDHLRALGQAGHDRGRDQIAAEGGDAVGGLGALLLEQGHQLGEAALAVDRRDLVDVVAMQEGDRDRRGRRSAACQAEQQEDEGEQALAHGAAPGLRRRAAGQA